MLVSRKQYFTTREHYSEICRSPRSWVVAQVRRGGEPDVTTPVSVDIVQVIAKAMFRYAGILPNPQDWNQVPQYTYINPNSTSPPRNYDQ